MSWLNICRSTETQKTVSHLILIYKPLSVYKEFLNILVLPIHPLQITGHKNWKLFVKNQPSPLYILRIIYHDKFWLSEKRG